MAFPAMGTSVAVMAPEQQVFEALRLVRGLFRTWEAALSRFIASSDLSRLNAWASREPYQASPLLTRVLSTALKAAEATSGTFDPAILPALESSGYTQDFAHLKDHPGAPPSGPDDPGSGVWRLISITPEGVHRPFGVRVDLGGIAKGMAVDASLDLLRERGIGPALVNAGGDLAASGPPPGEDSWPIAVEGIDGVIVPLKEGALATSSRRRRQWTADGERRHHLIDPSTRQPVASPVLSVTVAAGTAATAEVAAKTAFIRGETWGGRFLSANELAGAFSFDDGTFANHGLPLLPMKEF